MIFYKNGYEINSKDIITVWTAFLSERPDGLTTISGLPTKYCRQEVTTTSGVFTEFDNVVVRVSDYESYQLQYVSYQEEKYTYIGYNI